MSKFDKIARTFSHEPLVQPRPEIPLIAWDRAHRNLALVLAALLLLNLTIRTHGYSFSIWHKYLDHARESEILSGVARHIRADDFAQDIPNMLSQEFVGFSLVNPNVGLGQNMLAPIRAPVLHPSALFRASTWGYFLNADFGLSWMWWTNVIGLFYASFLFLMLLTRNLFLPSVLGAWILVYSPYFQFWSFHKAEIATRGLFAVVSFLAIVFSEKVWKILLAGFSLGWFAGSYAVDFVYPPIQVSVAYFLILALGVLLWERRRVVPASDWGVRGLSICISFAIAGGALFSFYDGMQVSNALSLITHTVYPGERFSSGGGLPLWQPFNNQFLVTRFIRDWVPLSNICESASSFFFSPLICIFALLQWKRKRNLVSRSFLCFLGFSAFLLFYASVGVPAAFAKWTYFSKVTSNRIHMALVLSELCLLFIFLREFNPLELDKSSRMKVLGLWIFFMAGVGISLHLRIPEYSLIALIAVLGLNAGLGTLLLAGKRELFLSVLAILTYAYTLSFNPITLPGGPDYVLHHPLSVKLREISKADPNALWVTFVQKPDSPHTAIPRMLGVHSIDGYHSYPHFGIWEKLDPTRNLQANYNQAAWISFVPHSRPNFYFEHSPGLVRLYIRPEDPFFRSLGVRYCTVISEDFSLFERNAAFELLFKHPAGRIYRMR